jgi:hypothetical protein
VRQLRDDGPGPGGLFWSPRPLETGLLEAWITSPAVAAHL